MKKIWMAVGIAVAFWLLVEFIAWQRCGNSELFHWIFNGRTFSIF